MPKGTIDITGPNTSLQPTRMVSLTSASSVGGITAPWRGPPTSCRAPPATASAIQASMRRAASSLITGPTTVFGSAGSP